MTHDALETTTRRSMAIMDRLASSEGSASLYILWGFFAAASIAAAVAVCFTPGADRRLAAAMSTPPSAARIAIPIPEPDGIPRAQPDEDALAVRLRALEDQLGTLTGSVSAASGPSALAERGVTPSAAPAPEPLADVRTVRTTVVDSRATDADAPVTRTQFAIDLGTEASFGALRIRWDSLRREYPELGRLSPRIAVRDRNGRVELRLVAGPFDNAADAARACAALLARGAFCDGSLFDGQHLPAT